MDYQNRATAMVRVSRTIKCKVVRHEPRQQKIRCRNKFGMTATRHRDAVILNLFSGSLDEINCCLF